MKIRDERVWFLVFPGRDGARYTRYRLPQSVLGVAAIELADATGPVTEARRRFFFVLTSAFACALVSVAFTLWFRRQFSPGTSTHALPSGETWTRVNLQASY